MRITPEEQRELLNLERSKYILVPGIDEMFKNKVEAEKRIEELFIANSDNIVIDNFTEENYNRHIQHQQEFKEQDDDLLDIVKQDMAIFPDSYLQKVYTKNTIIGQLNRTNQKQIRLKRNGSRGRVRNSAILRNYYLIYMKQSALLQITPDEVRKIKAKYQLLHSIVSEIIQMEKYKDLDLSKIHPPIAKPYITQELKIESLKTNLKNSPTDENLLVEFANAQAYLDKMNKHAYRPIDYLKIGLSNGIKNVSMSLLTGIMEFHLSQELQKVQEIGLELKKLKRRCDKRIEASTKDKTINKIVDYLIKYDGIPQERGYAELKMAKSTFYDNLPKALVKLKD